MRKLLTGSSVLCLALGLVVASNSTSLAADTHVVVGNQNSTWSYNGKSSDKKNPVLVDDLKKGDIVEIQIPDGTFKHGFITIENKVETKDLVWACGDAEGTKPKAVLREIDCGDKSKFAVKFAGSMRLKVLDGFRDEINFWCLVHLSDMAGILKLKQ